MVVISPIISIAKIANDDSMVSHSTLEVTFKGQEEIALSAQCLNRICLNLTAPMTMLDETDAGEGDSESELATNAHEKR